MLPREMMRRLYQPRSEPWRAVEGGQTSRTEAGGNLELGALLDVNQGWDTMFDRPLVDHRGAQHDVLN